MAESRKKKVTTELVTAVAEDGEWVEGALYIPGAKVPKNKPSLVLVHGAFGSFYTGLPRALGPRLAAKGYATLAMNTRYHDLFEMDMIFEEEVKDIRAAVRFLHSKGSPGVVLLGHSLGVPRVAHYKVKTGDPAVVGLVLVSGNASATEWMENVWGRETLDRYRELARQEGSRDPLHVISIAESGERLGAFEWYHPKRPAIITHRTMSARAFLDYMGEDTGANAIKYMKDIDVPTIILHGEKDELVPPGDAKRLKEANPEVELKYIKGAAHYYRGYESELVGAIVKWLRALGELDPLGSGRWPRR